ncbi:MAG: hypothetical protein IH795_02435, partial [Bacteroidetes bacterium]|nr:hypothetical protein [Bacteroidota bacterium]
MNTCKIIMYHYVRPIKNSQYPRIKGLEIDAFKRQINYFKKNFHILTASEFIDGLISIMSIVTSRSKFTFLMDDYNLFDRFTRVVLSNIIPLLQVNGIKVIISESSDLNYVSDTINNVREVTIGSIT